jgi:hypothetical protein
MGDLTSEYMWKSTFGEFFSTRHGGADASCGARFVMQAAPPLVRLFVLLSFWISSGPSRRLRTLCDSLSAARCGSDVNSAVGSYKDSIRYDGSLLEKRLGIRCSATRILTLADEFDRVQQAAPPAQTVLAAG